MMDISVSGGAPGTDASASVRSGRGAGKGETADQNGGFSDVLSKAGNSDQDADTVDTSGHQDVNDGAETVGRNLRGRNPKPLIELNDASLQGQVDVQSETIASVEIHVKSEKDQGKNAGVLGLGKPGAKDQAAEAAAQAVVKPAKHTKTNELDSGIETGADTAAGEGDITDVLGLLKKEPGDAAAILQASAHQVAAKTDDAPAGKKDAQTGGIHGAKADAHVSDALAAVAPHGNDARAPGTENAEGVESRTFRISRADGRGQSMDMHIGTEQPGEKSAKSSVENVAVLESRRYLGLVQNQNSANVTAALSGDKEWAQAMQPSSALSNAAEWTSTGKVVNTLKIQMSPIDLGLVTATMRLSGDTLNVDLKVETGAAYRQLKEDHGKILEALRSQGYAVDNVTVSMAPVDRSDAGNQANSQGQTSQQQQQSLAQQGQGGEARERQNQTARQTDGGFNGTGGNGVENASASVDAGGSRSGSVYL
ncbi:flagellar hook-length control protein FliK [Rhizobium sp. BK196]|uniref:flagellar hook-length control protein FliK n=1 Tax=Rhizobium sp. BK196 TaxID=2587073 RepID=UPI00160B6EDE|nr:flagellar hook-length control protein FliK [Rhizobium sp. BK196]